jgi:tetratricopeptide (TPR) repeat protein
MTAGNSTPGPNKGPGQAQALALQLLQKGNPGAAEDVLKPLLVRGMTDELVPTLAMIRLQQGRFPEAAQMFERARAIYPRDSRFVFLHGAALAGMGQWDKAIPAFQEAIKREPHMMPAYLSLGDAQRKLRQLPEAQATFRKLLRLAPDNADGLLALSSVLMEMGQPADAEVPLRKALLHVQDRQAQAALHNNLSVCLGGQNRTDEALESLERAQALAPELPNMDQRRIDLLYKLGRFADCETRYKKLLERNPSDPQLHRAYNSLLYRLGRTQDYLASYDSAPQTRELLLGKAALLMLQKRSSEAQDIFNNLLLRDPLDMAAAAGWANSLMLQERHGESLAAFEAIINRRGANSAVFDGAANAALLVGDPQKAEYFCQAGLRQNPYDQSCLALLGTAWRLQDDEQDESLNGYDSLVLVFDLEPPDGFSSMESFNAELAAYLERLHPQTGAYLGQSLRGGTQTEGLLFGAGHALVEKLRARIEDAMLSYVAALSADDRHPFLARRAKNIRYAGAWSSLLRDQGFHVNHLHPEGWISSCYYVAVPEVAKDRDTRQGWIKFGEPSFAVPLKNPIRRVIQPVPGRLVLFPSYMWHGTIPFHAPAVRTTIAFDAVPGAPA